MLTFSAFVPHPPLLIPRIGKENLERLKDTLQSYQKLAQGLKESKAESLIIISPHGKILDNIFTINQSQKFTYHFEEFGDFATRGEYTGNFKLAQWLKKEASDKSLIHLIDEQNLDHGVTVPLFLLLEQLSNVKIMPLYYSGLSNKEHYQLGQLINKAINNYTEKVAIVASGDLSHCLTQESPAGYSPKGKKFDNKVIDLLNSKRTDDILTLDDEFIKEASECGLKSLLILLGILDKEYYTPELLTYEAPFGVGYLTMNFKI